MPTLNGLAAVAAANARTTNQPGACLNTVWQFYGSHPSTGPHAGQYPDAINGWQYAMKRHPGDANPPAGYPVYFDALSRPRYAGDTNYRSGDIVISLGGGLVRCTDGAGAGRMATMTIAQRARQIGRTYLGWCEDFLGYDVITTATASTGSTPIPEQEDENMQLTVIRNYNGGIGIVDDAGLLTPLVQMGEYNSYVRLGLVKDGQFLQQPDGTVWNALAGVTARVRAVQAGDPAAIAKTTAALVIPAVVAALQTSGAAQITQQQVQDAAEAAIRQVFADAAAS